MNPPKPPPKPVIIIIQQYLEKWFAYRYNIVTGKIEYQCLECDSWVEMEDYDYNSLLKKIQETGTNFSIGALRNLLKSDFVPRFDPFRSYFESLPIWDGKTDYIGKLGATVQTIEDVFWQQCFKKWIVAAVACLLDDKVTNHTMIIFTGEQGIGKTTWSEKLVPEQLIKYMYSGLINPDNKDTLAYLTQCFLVIVDELETLTRRQLGSLKHLITKTKVKYRPPYGYVTEDFPRRASFFASINDKEFLTDLTGSRRFLTFEVLDFISNHGINLDNVYAQAFALWKSGFKFWFDRDEIIEINKNNEEYRVKSIEEEIILSMYEPCERGMETDRKTASEILAEIHQNNKNNINNWNLINLGKLLKHLGFIQYKSGGRLFYYVRARNINQSIYSTGYNEQHN
ncbi:MAG TPA: virulence-associated e family protein [Prolixibacteraceae bacterium]|nr:virulence-associated e family protein [Prolixibacteraceae bacterium]